MENENNLESIEPGTDPNDPSDQINSIETDENTKIEEEKDEKKKDEYKESQAPKMIFNKMVDLMNRRKDSKTVKSKLQVTIVILGLSGVGKTYILDRLKRLVADAKFNEKVVLINIDKFGSVKEGKWTIDVRKMIVATKVQDVGIYEGVSDNMDMVISGISNLSSNDLEASFYIKPDINLFKTINALKFQEGSEKGLPPAWLKGWERNSQIQGDEYEKLIKDNLEEMIKLCNDEDFPQPEVIPNDQESEVSNGWHKG